MTICGRSLEGQTTVSIATRERKSRGNSLSAGGEGGRSHREASVRGDVVGGGRVVKVERGGRRREGEHLGSSAEVGNGG